MIATPQGPLEPQAAPGRAARLTRRDLLNFEPEIAAALAAFLPCASHSLYFPRQIQTRALPLPDERRVLLPLLHHGEPLAVFVAKDVAPEAFQTPLPLLEAAATLAMQALTLRKAAMCDALTGLLNRQAFLAGLSREVELIENCLRPEAAACLDPGLSAFSARFGLIVADLDRFQALSENHGYMFGEQIIAAVADTLQRLCPEPATACRLAEDEFAILWPDASPGNCLKLAERLRNAVAELSFTDPVTGVRLRPSISLGVATYPADLSGPELRRQAPERGRMLLRKARKAALVAKEQGRNRTFAFGKVLEEGGLVLEVLPLGRLAVSLGRLADAREGMRFLVQSPRSDSPLTPAPGRPGTRSADHPAGSYPAMYKAEIMLSQVQEELSFAEILHLADPAWAIEPGDRLIFLEETAAMTPMAPADALHAPDDALAVAPRRDMLTGLYTHADFLSAASRAMRGTERFVLALLRLTTPPALLADTASHAATAEDPADLRKAADAAVRAVSALSREAFHDLPEGRLLAGRYGLAGLCFLLPDVPPAQAVEQFRHVAAQADERHGLRLAAGLAAHPYLTFAKADALENCRKALDHALLLPEDGPQPQVALFDSVSLNISADRHFGRGDIYAAMEEYKLARLADEANLLAANSLGICYARLGRLEQALGLFAQVAAQDPDNLMAHYNHGTVCLRLGDVDAARQAFGRCLALGAHSPGYVYSLVRLGQLAEREGREDEARSSYEAAAERESGSAVALRHLACLDLAAGNLDIARERLHHVLVLNPYDTGALALMAGIYLDTDQEPEIAETMARQCVGLRPDKADHWRLLARALEAAGKVDEARQARARAGE